MNKLVRMMIFAVCFCSVPVWGMREAGAVAGLSSIGPAPASEWVSYAEGMTTNAVIVNSTAYAIDLLNNQLVTFETDNVSTWTVVGPVPDKSFYAGDFLQFDISFAQYISAAKTNSEVEVIKRCCIQVNHNTAVGEKK